MPASRIAGTGRYLPANVLTNEALAQRVDTSDEWIRTRTGIRQRHIASDDEVKAKAGEAERPAPPPRRSTVPPAIPEAEVDAMTAPAEEMAVTFCWAEDASMQTGHCALAPGHAGPHKNRGGVWPQ